jgi:hypothetical protein
LHAHTLPLVFDTMSNTYRSNLCSNNIPLDLVTLNILSQFYFDILNISSLPKLLLIFTTSLIYHFTFSFHSLEFALHFCSLLSTSNLQQEQLLNHMYFIHPLVNSNILFTMTWASSWAWHIDILTLFP